MTQFHPAPSGNVIGKRLFYQTLIFAGVLTLLFFAIIGAFTYVNEIRKIEERFDQIGRSHVDGIRNSLWVNDKEHLVLTVSGIIRIPGIEYASIRSQGRLLCEAGQEKSGDHLSRRFPIFHTYNETSYDLGELYVKGSLDFVYQEMFKTLIAVTLTQAVTILMVCFLVLFLLYRTLGRRLLTITRYASSLSLESLDKPLVMEQRGGPPDEMDVLANTINYMRENLQKAFAGQKEVEAQLEKHRHNLEEVVQQRTASLQSANEQLKKEVRDREVAETALRESEERFKRLFEYAPLPYQSLDENGNFMEVNQSWLSIMGHAREEVIGKNFADFLQPNWQDHFRENFPRFKSIGEILGVEFQMKKGDGSFIDVSFDGKIGKNQAGEFVQTHCVFKDITLQKRLEEKIKEQEIALRKARKMEAIGTLTGGIAHEFNNMLGVILGNVELAVDDVPRFNHAHDCLMEIQKAGNRGKILVRQLMHFSRKSGTKKTILDLSKIVENVVTLFRKSCSKTVRFSESISENCAISGNDSQIFQMAADLLKNAVDALGEEQGTIDIRLDKVFLSEGELSSSGLPAGEYIRLLVKDSGPGIPRELIERVFDPFFTTKDVGKGQGLGLSVVHGVVQDHDGAIEVKSLPGQGAEFIVLFPAAGPQPEDS